MAEASTSLTNYSFECPPPFSKEDKVVTLAASGAVSAFGGFISVCLIDRPAISYQNKVAQLQSDSYGGTSTPAENRELKQLIAHPVKDVSTAKFVGVIAGEMGLGMALALPLVGAVRLALFKRKMKRTNAIVDREMNLLEIELQLGRSLKK